MRLLLSEVDKRVHITLDKSIRDGGVNGVMNFGAKNDYPQIIERIINASLSAKSIINVKAKFLIGDGFADPAIGEVVVGKDYRGKNLTLNMLTSQIAYELSATNGAYIHRNITTEFKTKNAKYIPFKYCRFAKPDSSGYSAKICVYENWEKDIEAINKFDKNNIKSYPIFSANKNVITAQIDGDFEKFEGQLNYLFFDNQYLYPLSPIDCVYLDCDTEAQISLYKNNQLRNGLLDKILLRIAPNGTDQQKIEFATNLKKSLGADGDPVICLEDDIDPETNEIKQTGAFKMETVKSNINDKLFESWEKSLFNNIRMANDAFPDILVHYVESSLGATSGEAIQQAVNFYNAMTRNRRSQLSAFLKETLEGMDGLPVGTDFEINELTLVKPTFVQPVING